MARRPSIFRPGTPGAGGGLSLGAALSRLGQTAGQRRRQTDEDRERSRILYFQANDAWASDYNDALVSGELERMEPAELNAWGDEKIEELVEPMAREFPDRAEEWRAGARAKLAPLIAGKVEEEKRESQARLLGQITEARERIRRELPEQLRLIADPNTPGSVRVASFGVIDTLTKEHDQILETMPDGEDKERARGDFAGWMNLEKLQAAIFHYASEGRMLELEGRVRNRTDYWDPGDLSRARITGGIEADTIQAALEDGWRYQGRLIKAAAFRRQTTLDENVDMRKRRYELVRDGVLSGRMTRETGIEQLRRYGYEGGAESVTSLIRDIANRAVLEDELADIDMERDGQAQARHQAALLGVRTLTALEARNSVAAARRARDAGLLTEDRFSSYQAAIEEEMTYRQQVEEQGTEAEKERNEQIRRARKAVLTELGVITFFDTGATSAHIQPAKVALAQRADYHLVNWIHRNEATSEQIGVAYETWLPAVVEAFTAMDLPKDLWTGEVPIVPGAGEEQDNMEISQPATGVKPGPFHSLLEWFRSDEGDAQDQKSAVKQGQSTAPALTELEQMEQAALKHLPIADLTQALDALGRHGQPVDTHRELFSLLPLGQTKAYVRYDESGAMDARKTLQAIEDAPNVSPEMAARIWTRVIAPVAASAEQVRGWRSGTDRAKDAAEWMRAKGL